MADEYDRAGLEHNLDTWSHFIAAHIPFNNATTPVLSYHMYCALARFPDVARKLREEQAAVERAHGSTLTWEALEACSYGQRFVQEVLRCTPPQMLLPRVVLKDLDIDGLVWVGMGCPPRP